MKIDKELIKHVSEVARLKLTEQEIEEFLPQLREVLEAFSKLKEVDTKGIRPSFQPVELKDELREDEAESSLSQEDALSNSPNARDGYFQGPKVV